MPSQSFPELTSALFAADCPTPLHSYSWGNPMSCFVLQCLYSSQKYLNMLIAMLKSFKLMTGTDQHLCMYTAVFTENELEKDPLKEVPAEPYELLDKTRYDFSSKQLPEDREAQLESIMSKLREECQIKGIMVSDMAVSVLLLQLPAK